MYLGYWPMGLVVCNMWQICDVMMCTSSIMHMCAISVTRYVGIRNPLGTRSKVNCSIVNIEYDIKAEKL